MIAASVDADIQERTATGIDGTVVDMNAAAVDVDTKKPTAIELSMMRHQYCTAANRFRATRLGSCTAGAIG